LLLPNVHLCRKNRWFMFDMPTTLFCDHDHIVSPYADKHVNLKAVSDFAKVYHCIVLL
jgi:hypothetical protein